MSRKFRWYADSRAVSMMVLANHPDWADGYGHVLLTVTRCSACTERPLDDEHLCFMPSEADRAFLERIVNEHRGEQALSRAERREVA